jgi:hypothetical protein
VSQLLIQHYLNELQTLRRVSGTSRESVVREAFKTLLKDWAKSHDLILIPEYEYQTPLKTRVYPDGALLQARSKQLHNAEMNFTKRPRMTPPLRGGSTAWRADRRRDPAPINNLRR